MYDIFKFFISIYDAINTRISIISCVLCRNLSTCVNTA